MKTFRRVTLLFCILLVGITANAQKYNYYQIFMYNFTKYIQWPDESMKGDFVIGVVGNNEIVATLEKMAESKTVGENKIKIQVLNSSDEASKCQMVFLPVNRSKMFDELKSKVDGKPVLLITEKEGLGSAGSAINFVVIDGKLKFELNRATTEKSNLKVSGDLAKLAVLI
ncbi:MAG: YfiR family protein [Cyclobacteriaceae bacterium]